MKIFYSWKELVEMKARKALASQAPLATTHYEGCWDSGPKHYECALLEVKRLRSESAAQLDELDKISDALGTNGGHTSVAHIKALRKLAEDV